MWMVLLAAILTTVLFLLNLSDYITAKRERRNGPVQFMNLDNLRHQGFILFIVLIVLARAMQIIGMEMSFRLVVGAILIDAVLTFFRRRKMAALVGEYLMENRS